jgi:hypothetical protein
MKEERALGGGIEATICDIVDGHAATFLLEV